MKKLILIALILFAVLLVMGGYRARTEEQRGTDTAPCAVCEPTPEQTAVPTPVPTVAPTVVLTPTPMPEPAENDQLDRRTAWMLGNEPDPAWEEYGGESFSEILYRLTEQYGLSMNAACGIAANMWFESGWEPQRCAYDGSGSYGLCQWLGGRCSGMWWWCERNDYDGTTVEGQIAYMMHEMDAYQGVELTGDAYDAAYTFCVFFEAPNDTYSQAAMRARYAEELEGLFA